MATGNSGRPSTTSALSESAILACIDERRREAGASSTMHWTPIAAPGGASGFAVNRYLMRHHGRTFARLIDRHFPSDRVALSLETIMAKAAAYRDEHGRFPTEHIGRIASPGGVTARAVLSHFRLHHDTTLTRLLDAIDPGERPPWDGGAGEDTRLPRDGERSRGSTACGSGSMTAARR